MTTTNLDDIVKRLESATSRLEALAAAGGSASATNKSSPATGGGGGGGSSAASVAAYSEIFAALKTFADAGRAIGGVVKDQVSNNKRK